MAGRCSAGWHGADGGDDLVLSSFGRPMTVRLDLLAFGGGHTVAPEGKFVEAATGRGAPRLTLLSPTPERLIRLFKVWGRTGHAEQGA